MNYVTTATSFPPLCRHYGQHGQKCEAQEVSWSRTHKQLEAWLRPRPRITGSSAEKLARMGGTSACWVQYITESTEGGAMHHLREGFSFFLANSHNRGPSPLCGACNTCGTHGDVWGREGSRLFSRVPPLPRAHQTSAKETHHETSRMRPASSRTWLDALPGGVEG